MGAYGVPPPFAQRRLFVGEGLRRAAFPCTGGLILEEAPLCKGSSRGAGEGLFLLSFCRIIQSAICLYNPSDIPNGMPPPFTQGRLLIGEEQTLCYSPLHKGAF